MVEPPLVTVNILSHNRRNALETCLRMLRSELDYPPDRLEFIVVDNGSADGTREMLRASFTDVHLIENPNVGAAGWTRGFQLGRGDYFLVLDDDCYLTGDALARAIEVARAERADLVSFRVISAEDPSYEFTSAYRVGLLSFWACAALISRNAVEQLGGFDPRIFIWGNELEFTIRLLDHGLRHLYLPEVAAVHLKSPVDGVDSAAYAIHLRHLAYIATKLLRRKDATAAIANLAVRVMLETARTPSGWRAVPALASGAIRGIRNREPVRSSVSSIYRHNFREFDSPLRYLGDPVGVWRGSRYPGSLQQFLRSRQDAYCARRPAFYPAGTASLTM